MSNTISKSEKLIELRTMAGSRYLLITQQKITLKVSQIKINIVQVLQTTKVLI